MSLLTFPFVRKSYPSLGNPAYVDDIVAANQLTLDGLAAFVGSPNPSFYVINGLGGSGTGPYTPGTIYLNGKIYIVQNSTPAGTYLTPTPVDTLSEPFSDTNARNIYTLLQASSTTDPTGGGNGASPLLTGNIDKYRIDLNSIKLQLTFVATQISQLGGSAFLNVGTTPNTVAAGDDARFGYSETEINTLFALKTAVLLQGNPGGNQTGFVPSNAYDPATKIYVDKSGGILVRSSAPVNVGDVTSGGVAVGVSFGLTLASTSYMPVIILYSNGTPQTDTTVWYTIERSSMSTTGFTVRFQEGVAGTQNLSFDWFVLSY